MSDLRADIAAALDGWLTPEQLKVLLDEILAIKKGARGWCPGCKKAVMVEISDAKAVVGAMADLANQGFGRPGETVDAESERISFERVVYLGDVPPDELGSAA
jgi:hypothetical protein